MRRAQPLRPLWSPSRPISARSVVIMTTWASCVSASGIASFSVSAISVPIKLRGASAVLILPVRACGRAVDAIKSMSCRQILARAYARKRQRERGAQVSTLRAATQLCRCRAARLETSFIFVIASEAKRSSSFLETLDCFASLAMTERPRLGPPPCYCPRCSVTAKSKRMSIKNRAYLVGAYEHPTRHAPDKSLVQLHAECAYGAIADAGLTQERHRRLFLCRRRLRPSAMSRGRLHEPQGAPC